MNSMLNGERAAQILTSGCDYIAKDTLSSFGSISVHQYAEKTDPTLQFGILAHKGDSSIEELDAAMAVDRLIAHFAEGQRVVNRRLECGITTYSNSIQLAGGLTVKAMTSTANIYYREHRTPSSDTLTQTRNIADYIAKLPGAFEECLVLFGTKSALGEIRLMADSPTEVAIARSGIAVEQEDYFGPSSHIVWRVRGQLQGTSGQVSLHLPNYRP